MIKSPLRYPGGKSRAVEFLQTYIPEFKELREVFFGGGSLSLYLLQQYSDRKYRASDINYELHCFWTQLQVNKAAVIKGVQKLFDKYKASTDAASGRKLFVLLVKRRSDELTELQRSIDFFVLNRITFSGVVDSGGYSQASFDTRFTQTSIDRLNRTSELIQSIQFSCDQYTKLLKKKGKDVFIFLDPPYYSATKSKLYGKNGILHTQFDHEKLCEQLKQCEHKWMITYDDSKYIRKLYKGFYMVDWKLQYGMTNSKNSASRLGNELLIANYDLKKTALSNL